MTFSPTPQLFGSRRRFVSSLAVGSAAVLSGAAMRGAAAPLHFTPDRDWQAWQRELRARLATLLAMPATPRVALEAQVERESETAHATIERVRFTAEPGEQVPGYLLRPKGARGSLPVMICLQGHSPGMHLSLGRANNDAERTAIAGGRDLAIQAIAHGWAALVIEQRGFGVRTAGNLRCHDFAVAEARRGRPLTGQRVLDVMRAIDFLATQPGLDLARLGCMGNSTGGTVSFYAAALEPRIALAVVSCSFCTFEDSWLSIPHCACGTMKEVMETADMPDYAGLIAPRRLLIVAGKQDPLARFSGVEQGFARARRIFAAGGAADRVRLVAGEGGHQFYPELAWPAIAEMMRL